MLPKTFFSFLLIALVSALLSYRFVPAIRQILVALVLIFVIANAFWFWMRSKGRPGRTLLSAVFLIGLVIIGGAYLVYLHEKAVF